PDTVTAGNASTLTFDVGSSTPFGTYTVTMTGTGTSAVRTATVLLTVTAPSSVTNGGFEAGLTGWSTGGFTPAIVTGKKAVHSGTKAVQIGSTNPFAGNSTLTQTVTLPDLPQKLTFWCS